MTPDALIAAMEATWPAAEVQTFGPVVLRRGAGGGKRVSAASVIGEWTPDDLAQAETAMRAWAQTPLFQLLPGQAALDHALAQRGYARIDPVLGYAARLPDMIRPVPPMAAFAHWPPLEIARDIWAEAGIGPDRVAVMDRVTSPKAVILARAMDRPAGAGFVALHGDCAMLHALEVRPSARRQGVASQLMAAAAHWAAEHGARDIGLVVTEANSGARALYQALGMTALPGYHYREQKT